MIRTTTALLALGLTATTAQADITDPDFDTNSVTFSDGSLNTAGVWVGRSNSYSVSGGVITQTNAGGSGTRFGQVFLAGDLTGTGWSLEVDVNGINPAGNDPVVKLYAGELLESPLNGKIILKTGNNTGDNVQDGTDVIVGGVFDYLVGNEGVSGTIDASDITTPTTLSFDISGVDLSAYDVMAVRVNTKGSQSNFLMIDRIELVQAGGGLLGDFDGDGDVDGVDIAEMFSNFNGPGGGAPTNPATDLDSDGDVDGVDIAALFGAFTGPSAPASVPEPASLALLGLGMSMLARRRR